MSFGQNSYIPIILIFSAFISTILVMFLLVVAAYGAGIAYADANIDAGHISELSFYIGIIASAPLWLAGIWIAAIAFAVGARPFFKWAGLGFLVSAAAVFFLMFVQRPDI